MKTGLYKVFHSFAITLFKALLYISLVTNIYNQNIDYRYLVCERLRQYFKCASSSYRMKEMETHTSQCVYTTNTHTRTRKQCNEVLQSFDSHLLRRQIYRVI